MIKVIRSGKTQNISVHDLLVGDVMHIETGDVVAVDGVLIHGSGIQVDESSLSGESDLVHKSSAIGTKASEADGHSSGSADTNAKGTIAGVLNSNIHRVSAADPFILSGTTVNWLLYDVGGAVRLFLARPIARHHAATN